MMLRAWERGVYAIERTDGKYRVTVQGREIGVCASMFEALAVVDRHECEP
jgi:hypothetical protein